MEERNVTVTLEKAKEWYSSGNAVLKEVALQAFSEEELNVFDFTKIRTFKDALLCLCNFDSCEYNSIVKTIDRIKIVSKASAAMFMLNIVRKVLNTGYNMYLTKNVSGQNYTWYPYFRFITKDCTCYNSKLKDRTFEKIGEITSGGVIYDVLGGAILSGGGSTGLGHFYSNTGVGNADSDVGFLSCATEEIAKHFGKYFGLLIMGAMYGDMTDFEIIG